MGFLYFLFGLAMFVLLLGGMIEQRRHYRNLESISARVMVNGIRGKSSITRLCAGALRGGGLRVVAKTTGTAARFISVDGSEVPVYRKFNIANVAEQIGVVSRAASEAPEAFVIECMAVDPALQEISQEKLIRSTIGVLCNVREDHLAEMGPTLEDVARSLSRTMPVDGICVTAESDLLWVLKEEGAKRRCQVVYADPESVRDEEMDPFEWFTFKENVAIAIEVAGQLGISREDALRGMYGAAPDPGVLTVETYQVAGKRIYFANIFAANDPNSTLMNVERLMQSGGISPPLITLINCRPDRVERNRQMGAIIPDMLCEKVIVIGHPSRSAIQAIPSSWGGRVVDLGGVDQEPDELFRSILAEVEEQASVVAIGNIHGQGERLLDYMEELGAIRTG